MAMRCQLAQFAPFGQWSIHQSVSIRLLSVCTRGRYTPSVRTTANRMKHEGKHTADLNPIGGHDNKEGY